VKVSFRIFAQRFMLIIGGLLLATVLLEAGLRVAALSVGPHSIGIENDSRKRAVLCLGDSHTYGVYYRPEEAYPGQLQIELDHRAPGRYRIVNLGLPGMNSSQIRASLPEWLDAYRPQAIIVGAGVNNFWNTAETEGPGRHSTLKRWQRSFRLHRLLSLLLVRFQFDRSSPAAFTERPNAQRVLNENGVMHRNTSGKILVSHKGNPKKPVFKVSQGLEILRRDLEAIHGLASRRDVRLIILAYSAFPLPDRPPRHQRNESVNEEMRRFGQEHDVTIVDLRQRFLNLLSDGVPREKYFANEKDAHPNPTGYFYIASAVADVLEPDYGGSLP
jgi:lysophospholipase L1-like esterase